MIAEKNPCLFCKRNEKLLRAECFVELNPVRRDLYGIHRRTHVALWNRGIKQAVRGPHETGYFFYVLFTMHLSIILVTDQLNTQILVL